MGAWVSRYVGVPRRAWKRSLPNVSIHRHLNHHIHHNHHHHRDQQNESSACNLLGGPFVGFSNERLFIIEIILMVIVSLGLAFVVLMRVAPNLIPGFKGQTVARAMKRQVAAFCAWSISAILAAFFVFATSARTLCLVQKMTLGQEITLVILFVILGLSLFAAIGCYRVTKKLKKQAELTDIPLA